MFVWLMLSQSQVMQSMCLWLIRLLSLHLLAICWTGQYLRWSLPWTGQETRSCLPAAPTLEWELNIWTEHLQMNHNGQFSNKNGESTALLILLYPRIDIGVQVGMPGGRATIPLGWPAIEIFEVEPREGVVWGGEGSPSFCSTNYKTNFINYLCNSEISIIRSRLACNSTTTLGLICPNTLESI